MEVLKVLFSFQGRIGRIAYWLGSLIVEVYFIASAKLCGALLGVPIYFLRPTPTLAMTSLNVQASLFALLVLGVGVLFVTWSVLAISVKRWHDRGKSGWWILIGLIPIFGALWILVECGFLPGTRGANRFGAAPDSPVEAATVLG